MNHNYCSDKRKSVVVVLQYTHDNKLSIKVWEVCIIVKKNSVTKALRWTNIFAQITTITINLLVIEIDIKTIQRQIKHKLTFVVWIQGQLSSTFHLKLVSGPPISVLTWSPLSVTYSRHSETQQRSVTNQSSYKSCLKNLIMKKSLW